MSDKLPAILLTVAAALLVVCHVLWGWVPVLDSANLAFHEAGHLVFGLLSSRLAVYGGTLMQLLMPAACAWECYRREQRYGFYTCLVWVGENLLDVYKRQPRACRIASCPCLCIRCGCGNAASIRRSNWPAPPPDAFRFP